MAIHSYQPIDSSTDLCLEKGEEYLILDNRGDWWTAKNKFGQVGLIPSNYVQEKSRNPLHQFEWFLPELKREEAEAILRNDSRDGAFLIRMSTTEDNCFTISLLVKK